MAEPVIVEIQGLDELMARLHQAPGLVRELAGDAIEKSLHLLHRRVAQYPAPPPGSTYVRTGTLGRRWTTKTDRQKLEGRLGNVTEYAPSVQDEGAQARVHRGRWPTVQGVASQSHAEMEGFFKQAGDELVRRMAKT